LAVVPLSIAPLRFVGYIKKESGPPVSLPASAAQSPQISLAVSPIRSDEGDDRKQLAVKEKLMNAIDSENSKPATPDAAKPKGGKP
jgi:hypothetical protein